MSLDLDLDTDRHAELSKKLIAKIIQVCASVRVDAPDLSDAEHKAIAVRSLVAATSSLSAMVGLSKDVLLAYIEASYGLAANRDKLKGPVN